MSSAILGSANVNYIQDQASVTAINDPCGGVKVPCFVTEKGGIQKPDPMEQNQGINVYSSVPAITGMSASFIWRKNHDYGTHTCWKDSLARHCPWRTCRTLSMRHCGLRCYCCVFHPDPQLDPFFGNAFRGDPRKRSSSRRFHPRLSVSALFSGNRVLPHPE